MINGLYYVIIESYEVFIKRDIASTCHLDTWGQIQVVGHNMTKEMLEYANIQMLSNCLEVSSGAKEIQWHV